MARWFGYGPPFLSDDRVMPFQTDERLIKNDLMQLLLTSPGERVMRSTYGTAIRGFVFEQMTEADINKLEESIRSAVQLNESRVSLTSIDIAEVPDNNRINITLKGTLVFDPSRDIEVSLEI